MLAVAPYMIVSNIIAHAAKCTWLGELSWEGVCTHPCGSGTMWNYAFGKEGLKQGKEVALKGMRGKETNDAVTAETYRLR